jgi:hypothetical protein
VNTLKLKMECTCRVVGLVSAYANSYGTSDLSQTAVRTKRSISAHDILPYGALLYLQSWSVSKDRELASYNSSSKKPCDARTTAHRRSPVADLRAQRTTLSRLTTPPKVRVDNKIYLSSLASRKGYRDNQYNRSKWPLSI